MITHLCRTTNAWADGTVIECGCYRTRGRAQPLQAGYQTKTRIRNASVDESPPGSPIVRHRDHFDGTIDGKVYPKPVRMSKRNRA